MGDQEIYCYSDTKLIKRWSKKRAPCCHDHEYAQKLRDYMKDVPYFHEYYDDKGVMHREPTPLPSISKFVREHLKVHQSTFNQWIKAKHTNDELKNPELFEAHQEFLAWQKEFLVSNALLKQYDSRMAIWMLEHTGGQYDVSTVPEKSTIKVEYIGAGDSKPVPIERESHANTDSLPASEQPEEI